jgi:glycosyltransferase involved in cell wall biosynthesis
LKDKTLLAYSDSASVFTGFGVVSKYILRALHDTGKYEIFQLAINSPTRFVDMNDVPWQQMSTRLLDPGDPYGKKLFLRTVQESEFDFIWILNDVYVTYDIAKQLGEILGQKASHGKKVPKVVYYYPVDCHAQESVTDMVVAADTPVCYNDHGRRETLLTHPEIEDKLRQIPHGVDTVAYRPLGKEVQYSLKERYLKKNAGKFAFLSVNRNSDRKQLSRTILAFSEFKKEVPDSVLLLHTMPIDRSMGRSIDLFAAVKDLGLSLTEDVLFPKYYEPSRGFPAETMNEIYNFADCFLHTSLGEGYGLSIAESLAAGTPVILPDNTNMRDFVGESRERGYMYPCREKVFVDNAGFRPMGRLDDIVYEMHCVHRAGNKYKNPKVQLARKWAEENDWSIICKQWIDLFEELETEVKTPEVLEKEIKGMIL